jgi:hypothetical protein
LVAVAAVVVPTAHADPPRFPDLGGFAQVNRKDYATYSAYSTTGVQFGTPAGYRCRMTYTFKASVAGIDCWGSLPGTTHNHVSVVDSRGEAALDDVDLAVMERYRYIDGTGWHDGVVSPDAYRFLPTHSKVSDDEPSSRTCGVDGRMTACELPGWDGERHGFVLTPEGSWTF